MNNLEIADILRNIAAAYEIKGENKFKVFAYQRAADAIEHASTEVKDLWDNDQLSQIPGVGGAISKHLNELFLTQKVKHFEEVTKNIPDITFKLLKIPGLGPKKAYQLATKLPEIKNLAGFEKAARENKIAGLPGFGKLSQEEVLKGLEAYRKGVNRENRMILPYADEIAQNYLAYLRENPKIKAVEALGSLRRLTPTVGDIDIAAAAEEKDNPEIIAHFVKYPRILKIDEKGTDKARVFLKNGRQIDFMIQPTRRWGSLIQHFTGSKHHNIALREYALKKGLSLSEYGIKKRGRLFEFAEEKKFYEFLGLNWIPPELREDGGEISAAEKRTFSDLLKIEDIKGDLQLHSNFPIEPSHDLGADTMEKMINEGIRLGYEYLGFSEHNPSLGNHTPSQITELLEKKKKKVEKLNQKFAGFHLFNLLEVDIQPNGSLALPEGALNYLDGIIASIHSVMRMDKISMTKRILTALQKPGVVIFAHPTGRLLGQREGYEFDFEKVCGLVRERGIALEINAWPNRLDLSDNLVRQAIKNKVKLIINTDSHAADQMKYLKYGVAQARRGWAEKGDIINTWGYDKISKWLTGWK